MHEPNETLSERELEILRLVATGAANKEIARQLVISPNTVKVHLRNIFAKIGVSSRTEATLYAMKIGLVKPVPVLEEAGFNTSSPEVSLEESQTGRTTSARAWKAWLISLTVLAVLVGAAIVVYPLIYPSPQVVAETIVQPTLTSTPYTRWANIPGLPSPRKGMGAAAYENAFYLIGGQTDQGVDGATLRYRPVEEIWESLPSKPTGVTDVQAALLGEKIYVPGGCLANGEATAVLEVFDPRQNGWEAKAPLPEPICAYGLATYEGRLYLFGGKRGSNYLAKVYIYDPLEDRWQERQPLSTPRAYVSAVEVNGKIQVIGGYDGKKALSLNEAYFPNRETTGEESWETYSPLPAGRYAMGATQLAGLVYLLGGSGNEGILSNPKGWLYIPQTDEWYTFESPPEPAGALPAVLTSGNFLYMLGGETPTGLSADQQSYQAIYTISVPIISDGK